MVDKQIQGTLMNVCEHRYFRECTHFAIAYKHGVWEMLYPLSKETFVLIVMFLINYRQFQNLVHCILEVIITFESSCISHKPIY